MSTGFELATSNQQLATDSSMNTETIIFFCVAAAVSLVVYFLYAILAPSSDERLRDRLVGAAETDATQPNQTGGVTPILQRVSQAAAQPFMPKTREAQSEIRRRLGLA